MMTYDQARESLERVMTLFAGTSEEKAAYVKTIHEACGWMKSYAFDQSVKEVVATMAQGRRPVPAQFIAAYHKLDEKAGWSKSSGGAKKCSACDGVGMVYRRYRRESDGHEGDFCRPCPDCASTQPVKELHGWTMIDPAGRTSDQMFRSLGPRGAKWVLDQIERSNEQSIPQETVAHLMETASKPVADRQRQGTAASALADALQSADPLPEPMDISAFFNDVLPRKPDHAERAAGEREESD